MESFVWTPANETTGGIRNDNGNDNKSEWRVVVDCLRSTRIYDSDPQSLRKQSHAAWKKELHLTRFANQELPEALWGSNFLSLTCSPANRDINGNENGNENGNDNKNGNGSSSSGGGGSTRISFCALEALRTWALMDMERGPGDSPRPTVFPHSSGAVPDAWDYTYTTNYAGSVEAFPQGPSVSPQAAQPDGTTVYATRVEPIGRGTGPEQGFGRSTPTTSFEKLSKPQTPAEAAVLQRFAIAAELRPPLCKCVGGRMICAGVARTLRNRRGGRDGSPEASFPRENTGRPFPPSATTDPPAASPDWTPLGASPCAPAFDLEGLLNDQRSLPLYSTGTIPLWIQNLDPHSYSFLTVAAVVFGGSAAQAHGFLAVVLRCFVRVNGVGARLVDARFLFREEEGEEEQQAGPRERDSRPIRDAEGSENKSKSNHQTKGGRQNRKLVVLRERSWREGTWEQYTAGMRKGQALGTDLEQGKRASKNLPHKMPPRVDRMVLWESDGDRKREAPTAGAGGASGVASDSDSTDGTDEAKASQTRRPHHRHHHHTEANDLRGCQGLGRPPSFNDGAAASLVQSEAWTVSVPWNRGISIVCSSSSSSSSSSTGGPLAPSSGAGARILAMVVDGTTVVALDPATGGVVWEHDPLRVRDGLPAKGNGTGTEEEPPNTGAGRKRPSLVSLAVHHHRCSPPGSSADRLLVGDDRGSVHVIECGPLGNDAEPPVSLSQRSYSFRDEDSQGGRRGENGSNRRYQTSLWVDHVAWDGNGRSFAAAAGKKLMINGNTLETKGTIYGLKFLPEKASASGDRETSAGDEPLEQPHQLLAVAIYGGLVLVDAGSMEVRDQAFGIGNSAVLSLAVAGDGGSIGIGCLDKRLRVYRCTRQETKTPVWKALDWIGFDGKVTQALFSPGHQKLAALGGSMLVVLDASGSSEWGEAPVVCSLWPPSQHGRDNGRGQTGSDGSRAAARFGSFAWASENLLVAFVAKERVLHVFDVRKTTDAVPKRCHPVVATPFETGFAVLESSGGNNDAEGGELLVWGQSQMTKMKLVFH